MDYLVGTWHNTLFHILINPTSPGATTSFRAEFEAFRREPDQKISIVIAKSLADSPDEYEGLLLYHSVIVNGSTQPKSHMLHSDKNPVNVIDGDDIYMEFEVKVEGDIPRGFEIVGWGMRR